MVNNNGISRELVDTLRDEIWSTRLAPGERLNEHHLATAFGVSRPPLREAIRTLEADGLVTSIPRRGSFVRVLSRRDIQEIYTVRHGMELMAAEIIMNSEETERIVAELDVMLTGVEHPAHNLRSKIDADLDFHRAFVRFSGNRRLLRLWEEVIGEVRLALTIVTSDFFETSYLESTHRAMISAMATGDLPEIRRLFERVGGVVEPLCEAWDRLGANVPMRS